MAAMRKTFQIAVIGVAGLGSFYAGMHWLRPAPEATKGVPKFKAEVCTAMGFSRVGCLLVALGRWPKTNGQWPTTSSLRWNVRERAAGEE